MNKLTDYTFWSRLYVLYFVVWLLQFCCLGASLAVTVSKSMHDTVEAFTVIGLNDALLRIVKVKFVDLKGINAEQEFRIRLCNACLRIITK